MLVYLQPLAIQANQSSRFTCTYFIVFKVPQGYSQPILQKLNSA